MLSGSFLASGSSEAQGSSAAQGSTQKWLGAQLDRVRGSGALASL